MPFDSSLDDLFNSVWEIKPVETWTFTYKKDEPEKKQVNEKEPDDLERKDNRDLRNKLKKLQYIRSKEGYLTYGDLMHTFNLDLGENVNEYKYYCGDIVKYNEEMTKLAMGFYRKYRKLHDEDYYTEFLKIQTAMDKVGIY